MKTKLTLLMCLGLIMTSCSVGHIYLNESEIRYATTDHEKIEVYVSDNVDKPYKIIGEVIASVEDFDGAESSTKALRREAAKLGAHAVINLRIEIGHSYLGNSVVTKGVAVRFTN